MSEPILEQEERGVRLIHGTLEHVEEWIERHKDSYLCTNLYFHMVENHLEVAATMLHQRELRRAQLAQSQIPPGLKMRPN